MNIFRFRNQIIEDYRGYVSSFISIALPQLSDFVKRCFTSGSLWPDPLIQLNPTFKPGQTVDELASEGLVEPGCRQVFRREKTVAVGSGEDLLLHQHQEETIRKAKEGRNYVLTTGTGSGKSLSYIVPIVDHVLRTGSGRGIQAIIIYCQEEDQNLTQRINVSTRPSLDSLKLFGGGVSQRSELLEGFLRDQSRQILRDPEIGEPPFMLVRHDVLRFQITMDDVMVVQFFQCRS